MSEDEKLKIHNTVFQDPYTFLFAGNHQRLQQDKPSPVLFHHYDADNIHASLCPVSDPNGVSNARLGAQEEQQQQKSNHLLS